MNVRFRMRGLFLLSRSGWAKKVANWYRAFADYVFGSVILHFFCVNFIN